MTYRKTINFVPQRKGSAVPQRLPFLRSFTAALAIAVLAIAGATAWRSVRHVPIAVAEERPKPPPTDAREVAAGDPAAASLWCAAGWLPWPELCSELPQLLRDRATLESIRYEGRNRSVVFTGWAADVNAVSELMLALDKMEWLANPIPIQVTHDPRRRGSTFRLKVDCIPYVELEGRP